MCVVILSSILPDTPMCETTAGLSTESSHKKDIKSSSQFAKSVSGELNQPLPLLVFSPLTSTCTN